jgi:hypothetical protein
MMVTPQTCSRPVTVALLMPPGGGNFSLSVGKSSAVASRICVVHAAAIGQCATSDAIFGAPLNQPLAP